MVCQACGTQNPEKASFCSRCGKRIRPATVPPIIQSPEVPPPPPPPPPPSGTGASWIDPQAARPKPGDSWIQTDTPPLPQPPFAQNPVLPPPPPASPPAGASWIDPSLQGARPADSWVKFGQPPSNLQGGNPPPPAPGFAPPAQHYPSQGHPPPAYNPAYGQPQYGQPYPPPGYAAPGQSQFLRGVGGWLMFLVVCLTILGPFVSLLSVIVLLLAAGALANSNPELVRFFLLLSLLVIPYSVWGLIVGMGLWKIRPGAVRQAKTYFLRGSIPFTFITNLLPFLLLSPGNQSDQAGASAFMGIAFGVGLALAWNAYLTKSVRVANTYPQG